MLVDQHAYTDATHVEAVQEVLNAVLCIMVNAMRFLQLQNSLKNSTHTVNLITLQRMLDPHSVVSGYSFHDDDDVYFCNAWFH